MKDIGKKLMDIARWYSMPADHFNTIKEAAELLDKPRCNLKKCPFMDEIMTETELNELDCISRQAVDKLIDELARAISDERCFISRGRSTATIMQDILDLPSVSTEKTGRWIAQDIHNCHTDFKCSECGYIHNFMHLYGEPTADYTYCPNCGAKMEVEK